MGSLFGSHFYLPWSVFCFNVETDFKKIYYEYYAKTITDGAIFPFSDYLDLVVVEHGQANGLE